MVRGVLDKVMRLGRATVFLVGLAVILALLFGAATTALAHSNVDNKLFHLGHSNSAAKPTSLISTLADAATSALIVQNKSGGAALDLRVGNATTPANDVAPMQVNSNKVVTNLNADKLDDKEASDFYAAGSKVADSDKLDNKGSNDFAPQAVEAWREVGATNQPTFQNGWTNYGSGYSTVAFYKDPWSVVHLKGMVKGGSGSVFKLPCGYG